MGSLHYSAIIFLKSGGGAFSARLTEIPGASTYFLGAIVSYSNQAKMNFLGISAEELNHYGPVHEKITAKMAEGALHKFSADIAVGITGIVGPSGATETLPVGSVFIAIARKKSNTKVFSMKFKGSRLGIIRKTVDFTLTELLRMIL